MWLQLPKLELRGQVSRAGSDLLLQLDTAAAPPNALPSRGGGGAGAAAAAGYDEDEDEDDDVSRCS